MIDWADHDSVHVSFWIDGLCARLRSLSGAAAVAEIVGKPLSLSWAANPACPGHIDDVLEGTWETVQVRGSAAFDVNKEIPQCAEGRHYYALVKDRLSLEEYLDKMVAIRRSWRPVLAIRERMVDIATEHGSIDRMLGFHIRRTDMVAWLRKEGYEVLSDMEWLHVARSRMSRDGLKKVYVATCCRRAHMMMRNKLGPACVHSGAKYTITEGDRRQTDLAAAVLDMYMLSKCFKVYATPRSSFGSYVASLMPNTIQRFRLLSREHRVPERRGTT